MRNPEKLSTSVMQAAMLVLLMLSGLSPVGAAEYVEPVLDSGQPVIVELVRMILGDPDRNFSTLQSPSDCGTETMYLGTRDVLEKYVANPAEQGDALSSYILSGKDQCHCAEAIIGKDFDILLHDLGPETSGYKTCYGMPHG